MSAIGRLLVKIDYICDYVPIIRPVSNLIDLFQKCVILPFMERRMIDSSPYYKYIDQKSISRCIWLTIPIIGIIAGIYFLFTELHANNVGGNQVKGRMGSEVQLIAQTPINSQNDKLICFYKTGPTEFLGNFANCPQSIRIGGHTFKCSEAAFQWRKYYLAGLNNNRSDLLKDPALQKFFTCSGEEAYRLNRKLASKYPSIFPSNWLNGVRDQVMWEILNAKFQQNPSFAQLLKMTQGAYLLEHNEATRDDYWSDNSNGTGKNMLGKMLMALRDGTSCPPPNDSSDQVQIHTYARYANQPGTLNYQIF